MGAMRFLLPSSFPPENWPEAYEGFLSGADGRIYPTRVEIERGLLSCRRTSSETAKLQVAFPVAGHGRPMVSTAALPEREQPYLLAVELARGKLVQVRNQAASWEMGGLEIPDDVREVTRTAHRYFARAASSQKQVDVASELAMNSLATAFEAATLLTRSYARQALSGRQQRFTQLPLSFACELGQTIPSDDAQAKFVAAFGAATINVAWNRVEAREGDYDWSLADSQLAWCESQRLLVRGGPLLDFGPNGLPAWLQRWEHDFNSLQSFICDYVETAMARYQGRIRLWEVAARGNTGGALGLSEEARLTMLARTLDVARMVDEEAQLLLRIEQPWGEYQAQGRHRLSPLQLADALIRSGVGLAAINLELAIGYRPRGSVHRDLLEVSRLLDTWSLLSVPLYVTIACPAASSGDEQAARDIASVPQLWQAPVDESQQARWIEDYVGLMLAKPVVAGIAFSHVTDRAPHVFPSAGLLREDDSPRPGYQRLLDLRNAAAGR